jgi:pimeloyl-ACP methyl ester carboxylesterase
MTRPPPRIRRAYYDCRYGQLHLHNAIPAGGGFDELTPVLCVHGAGETGRAFAPLLAVLGDARSVYAPDMPGVGETDPAPDVAATLAAVHAVTDFVDSMRIRRFDLVAHGAGCAAALAVLAERGDAVRKVVLLAPAAAVQPTPRVTVLAEAVTAGTSDRVRLVLDGPT